MSDESTLTINETYYVNVGDIQVGYYIWSWTHGFCSCWSCLYI